MPRSHNTADGKIDGFPFPLGLHLRTTAAKPDPFDVHCRYLVPIPFGYLRKGCICTPWYMAALFTSMSIRPNRSTVFRAISSVSCSEVTSVFVASASPEQGERFSPPSDKLLLGFSRVFIKPFFVLLSGVFRLHFLLQSLRN